MNTVYMAPCGVGLGHVSRCEPIARELDRRGVKVVFSTYLDGIEYVNRKGFTMAPTVPISFKVKPDGTVDFKRTAATSGLSIGARTILRQLTREIKNMKAYRPDLVISDSRATPIIAARLLGIPTILLLNQYRVDIIKKPTSSRMTIVDHLFFIIANLAWVLIRTLIGGVWSLSNIIIIPDLPAPHTISLGNLAIPRRYRHKVALIGPIVTVKPKDLLPQDQLKEKLGLKPDKPLIYAAISGPKVDRTFLADKLMRILETFPREYQIVLSKANPNGCKVPKKHGNMVVHDWIENEFEYLKACDLVLSRAGHGTIMKALTYGKPLILIPIPDHTEQYGNAARAMSLGVADVIPQRSLNRDILLEKVANAFNPGEHATNAQFVGKFASEFNALKNVIQLAQKIGRLRLDKK